MRSWRYISVSREGWYYLFVVVFILGGAVLREVNLLIVLAGMMIGPFVFNWRLVTMMLRNLTIERRFPERVVAGEAFYVEVRATNHRRLLGTWSMAVEDSVRQQSPTTGSRTHAEVIFPFIGAGSEQPATWRCLLNRRGRYRFGPLRLSTGFPLGLMRSRLTLRQFDNLVVHPRQGRLTRQWEALAEANRVGEFQSHRRRGPMEGDYFGLREWRTGDSRRWIHWRTSARLGTLAVTQFEQQRSRDVAIVLDLWQEDPADDRQSVNVELAVSLAATAIADLCGNNAGRITFAVADNEPECWTAPASHLLATETLDHLATVKPSASPHLVRMVDEVLFRTNAESRMVVISTRSDVLRGIMSKETFSDDEHLLRMLEHLTWIDVGDGKLTDFFSLE